MRRTAFIILTGLLPGLCTAADQTAEVLGGISQSTNSLAFYGYLYVPTCAFSTSRVEGNLLENSGGALAGEHTLNFTQITGVRWAKNAPGSVIEDAQVNVVLSNCTLTQLHLQLKSGEDDTSVASADSGLSKAFIGAMTYNAIPNGITPSLANQEDVDPRWAEYQGVSSSQWLYYSVGASDIIINGATQRWLRLKKDSSGMQCTASEYCLLKLDNSSYLFSNEQEQERVPDAEGEWKGEWSQATSTLNNQTNQVEGTNDYIPSNLVNAATLILPLHIRLHHGTSKEDKDGVPYGEYTATMIVTVSFN